MAISMRNLNGKTPLELAEQFSHEKCVEILKNFSVSWGEKNVNRFDNCN